MIKKHLILTIDDDENIRECFTDILEDNDFDVIQAKNGKVGLELIEESCPDLILCDMQMPEVTGIEVVRHVHEHHPEIPIIVISGAGILNDAIEAVREGAWDYLVKPLFSLDTLVQAVNKELDKARLIAENKAYQKSLEKKKSDLEREIEERKKAEKKLIQSEKMAALGDLVAGVSHEINTPLGIGITGISYLQEHSASFHKLFSEGKAKKSDLENFLEECQEACKVTLTNLHRAAQLVTSFKQIAVDQSSDKKRLFNIKSYINEVLFSLHPKIKKTEHTIIVNSPDDIEIYHSPGIFSQIFTNLIMNSLQHGFENKEAGKITIRVEETDHRIQIVYSDDGAGMSDEQQLRIFDPFYTTKRGSGGTGLGMNLVYNLVYEKLDGEIDCQSVLNSGTTITISIPKTNTKQKEDV